MEATYHTKRQTKKITKRHKKTLVGTCLEVCCYGIDLGASIVRFNQSEHSISADLNQ